MSHGGSGSCGETLTQHSGCCVVLCLLLGEEAGAVPGDCHSCREQHVVWAGAEMLWKAP